MMGTDHLALDLDAFFLEHHRCDELDAGVVDESLTAFHWSKDAATVDAEHGDRLV